MFFWLIIKTPSLQIQLDVFELNPDLNLEAAHLRHVNAAIEGVLDQLVSRLARNCVRLIDDFAAGRVQRVRDVPQSFGGLWMEGHLGVRSCDGLGSGDASIVSFDDVIIVSNDVGVGNNVSDVLSSSRLRDRPAKANLNEISTGLG